MNPWWDETWLLLRHPLIWPPAVTAVAGLLAYVAARRAVMLARLAALVASAAMLVGTASLFSGERASVDLTWLAVEPFRLAIAMSSGTFGVLVALGASLFGLLSTLYAFAVLRGEREEGRFHAFLCWSLTGTFAAALADDLVWLLIGWELVSLCLYMLLNLGRGDARTGAARSFAMIGFGDAAMLLAIALIGATQGTFRMDELSIQVGTPMTTVCFLLFLAAGFAKAGAAPMQSWLPVAAGDALPAVMAFLPAAVDKLLGAYLLIVFSFRVFALDEAMRTLLLVTGSITVLAGAMMAMTQTQLRKMIAWQAISSTGYIILGIGTGGAIGIVGAVFHAINGAIYQSCLFMGTGNVQKRTGTDAMSDLGGLSRVLPGTFACSLVAALAISGVPPTNGFVSKWLVFQACLQVGTPLAIFALVAAVFGSALTLAASVKALALVFWGAASPTPAVSRTSGGRVAAVMSLLPMSALALLCLGFGVAAQWPLSRLILPVVGEMGIEPLPVLNEGASITVGQFGLWSPAPATIMVLLGVLGGLALYLIGRITTIRVARTFVGGEVVRDQSVFKLPASSFYRTVEEIPGIGAALRDGEQGAFDVYRLGGRYGGGIVEALRKAHSGVLSLYVSWCLFGAVIIIVYLMAVL